MKRKILFAAVTSALLGGAGIASAAQQLICDQQPSSTTSASCRFSDVPVSTSLPEGTTYYIVEPAARERTVVREPVARERVVIQESVTATPVDTIVMNYPVDDAFPDPNPRQVAQTRVYVPREPASIAERGFFGEVTPD